MISTVNGKSAISFHTAMLDPTSELVGTTWYSGRRYHANVNRQGFPTGCLADWSGNRRLRVCCRILDAVEQRAAQVEQEHRISVHDDALASAGAGLASVS